MLPVEQFTGVLAGMFFIDYTDNIEPVGSADEAVGGLAVAGDQIAGRQDDCILFFHNQAACKIGNTPQFQ